VLPVSVPPGMRLLELATTKSCSDKAAEAPGDSLRVPGRQIPIPGLDPRPDRAEETRISVRCRVPLNRGEFGECFGRGVRE